MTNSTKKPLTIVICKTKEKELIKAALAPDFDVSCYNGYGILLTLRTKQIAAIVCYIHKNNDSLPDIQAKVCYPFSDVPKVAVLKESTDIELIRKCGEIGMNGVIVLPEINELATQVHSLIQKTTVKIQIEDIGINTDELPEPMQRAFYFLESNYTKIKCIEEVTNYLGTTYKTLSNYFRQIGITKPKAVLMFLKVRHALCLLRQNNLSIKEIAYKSGFSDEKRLAECFKKMFDKPAGECACEIYSVTIDDFWNKNLKYKLFCCEKQYSHTP